MPSSTELRSAQVIATAITTKQNLDTADGGSCAIELWRGIKTSWQIANEDGYLYIRNNYNGTKLDSYDKTVIKVAPNETGAAITNLSLGTEELAINDSYSLYTNGQIYFELAENTINEREFCIGNKTGNYISIAGAGLNCWNGTMQIQPYGGSVIIGRSSDDAYLVATVNNGSLNVVKGLGLANTDPTTGLGISLYGGPAAGKPLYGIMFAGTKTFGKLQNTNGTYGVGSDWATYFTMNDNNGRGWIFKRGDVNVAAIDGDGTFVSSVSSGTHVAAAQGRVALDMSAPVGYNMFVRMKSINGAFVSGTYGTQYLIDYLTDGNISSGTNVRSYYAVLMDENGYSRFNRVGMNIDANENYILRVSGSAEITGSIYNLAVNGGIYWNPYVESATDGTDAGSIILLKSGAAGGTELRMEIQNDFSDIINFCSPAHIYLNNKKAFTIYDSWLRINEGSEFSGGIYTGTSLIRSDSALQVGQDGTYFFAHSARTYVYPRLAINGVNDNYNLYVNGTGYINTASASSETSGLAVLNGVIRITNYGYTLTIGNLNVSHTHFMTNCSSFYFNTKILVNGELSPYSTSTYTLGSSSNIWSNLFVDKINTAIIPINSDVPEGATNLAYAATMHSMTLYRNGITIPYQMDNANDGGILRCRGTETNCIFEMGTWDDSGAGETIQFNYYPTTSQVTPTYSVSVPKKTGTIALVGEAQPANGGNADTVDGCHAGDFLRSYAWWAYGDTYNANDLYRGTTFVYGNHTNAATTGTMVAFDCSSNSQYTLQIQGSYGSNYLYYRNRNGDNGTWHAWKRLWAQGDAVTGAVWNDYAEYRQSECEEPGRVVFGTEDGVCHKTTERLQYFEGVVSDTWGFSQGQTEKATTNIAVAGRVLVYTHDDRMSYHCGDCVCADENGTVSVMTREEIIAYPDRIVGTVSEIPTYETWGDPNNKERPPVKVNNRIWIKVR